MITQTNNAQKSPSKNKRLLFKLNGKTYSAKTNVNVLQQDVKLTKKATFTYTARFAGDATYKAVSKTNKIRVKYSPGVILHLLVFIHFKKIHGQTPMIIGCNTNCYHIPEQIKK